MLETQRNFEEGGGAEADPAAWQQRLWDFYGHDQRGKALAEKMKAREAAIRAKKILDRKANLDKAKIEALKAKKNQDK